MQKILGIINQLEYIEKTLGIIVSLAIYSSSWTYMHKKKILGLFEIQGFDHELSFQLITQKNNVELPMDLLISVKLYFK